jgi:TonB family protein
MPMPFIMLLAGAATPADAPPPPPMVLTVPAPPVGPRNRVLISWTPGEVRCAGAVVRGGVVRRPLGNLSYNEPRVVPVTYRFGIDASGRPLSLAREGEASPFGHDVAPALAASRFREGEAREDCSVTYTPRAWGMNFVPIEDLVSYTITQTSGPLPREGWELIRAGGKCWDAPAPQALLRAYPDFRQIAGTPGVKDWVLVGYDTDQNGVPTNMRTMHTTGNAALDAAAAKAVGDSRFTGGARKSCLYPYWKVAARLPAPPVPDEAVYRSGDQGCAVKPKWNSRPVLVFPDAWRRRSIEGWAIVSYDVAPWGGVGNVKVLASQPAEDFGRQAISIMQSGRAVASPQGATGCIETVRFVMGRGEREQAENAPEIF